MIGCEYVYAIEFGSTTRQNDVFDITQPSGYVLDGAVSSVKVSCDFATYQSKAEMQGGVLHYVRTLEIEQVHVPTEKLGDVKEFLQKVATD